MPFITNDFDNHLVDDDEYVGKYKDYVVARKLYVWMDALFPEDDYLHRRFRKYGNIESTKVLRTGKEGYVTFTCDRYACLAYDREKEKCVEVAHTWHQPRKAQPTDVGDQDDEEESMDTEETSPLLKLNDDCLFAVFDFCDNQSLVNLSETCTRFNTLLTYSYNFPKNKEFDLCGYDLYRVGRLLPLAVVRKILRLMGSYFQTLDLFLIDMEDEMVPRYFQIVMKYCKTNTLIRQLILVIYKWNKDFLTQLGPIFKNLQTLDICILDYKTNDVSLPDLTALCPNLKKITTNVFAEKCSKMTRPNLESFSFESYSDYLIDSTNALEFLANNPQIKIFKCSCLRSQDLSSLAVHLPNVQKLSLCVCEVSSFNDFINLKTFEHLTKLKLSFVEMRNINLREIIECFRGFSSLLELKLYFKKKNNQPAHEIQQSIIALSQMLRNLERFDLVGCKLVESTVVDFVQLAAKLKSLHFHICDVYATECLIKKLVTVRKSQQQDKLKLFLDDEARCNVVALNGADIQQYLNVEWNCEHDLRWV